MTRKILRGITVLTLGAAAGCAPAEQAPADAGAAPGDGPAQTATSAAGQTVLFLGTSLTAGYGLERDEAYPALLQARLDSLGWPVRVVNAGVSGATSAEGLSRIDWLLRQPVDVLVLELGANDGLRGQDIAAMRANLQEIIDRTRRAHPGADLVIAGMEALPNLGRRYTTEFRRVFGELARANDAALIPFLLEGVAADPALNQSDGIHPNVRGQRVVADNVWQVLRPVLERRIQ